MDISDDIICILMCLYLEQGFLSHFNFECGSNLNIFIKLNSNNLRILYSSLNSIN